MASTQTFHPDRKDELLTILADSRRRAIVRYLQEPPDDVVTVERLASELDSRDDGGEAVSKVTLLHADLPKLDAAGVVEFDERSTTVRYRAIPEVEALLQFIAEI